LGINTLFWSFMLFLLIFVILNPLNSTKILESDFLRAAGKRPVWN
jgi:hypothetical protein